MTQVRPCSVFPGRPTGQPARPECRRRRLALIFAGLMAVGLPFGLPAQTNTNVLAPPYGELAPTSRERLMAAVHQHEVALGLGGILFVALAGATIWLAGRPKAPIVTPPAATALTALTPLLGQPEDGRTLSEISRITRRYVAAAAALPGGELTTGEFIAALAGNERVGSALAQTILDLLRECDARKFSPAPAGAPLDAANRAGKIVLEMQQRLGAPAVQTSSDERRV